VRLLANEKITLGSWDGITTGGVLKNDFCSGDGPRKAYVKWKSDTQTMQVRISITALSGLIVDMVLIPPWDMTQSIPLW
jgi:hypothetical protein